MSIPGRGDNVPASPFIYCKRWGRIDYLPSMFFFLPLARCPLSYLTPCLTSNLLHTTLCRPPLPLPFSSPSPSPSTHPIFPFPSTLCLHLPFTEIREGQGGVWRMEEWGDGEICYMQVAGGGASDRVQEYLCEWKLHKENKLWLLWTINTINTIR